MTLFFSAAMLLLIVRLAKGEEKNMMFARVFSLASNVGFWIGIVRIAVLNRSGFLMFFYITGAMLSYTAMVFAMPHKKEQIAGQQAFRADAEGCRQRRNHFHIGAARASFP